MPNKLPIRVGGRLALDFVNTAEGRGTPEHREFLADYATLTRWTGEGAHPMPASAAVLTGLATEHPVAAQNAHRRAIALREALHAVFLAALTRQQVAGGDLALVNDELCDATNHHMLRPDDGGGVRDGWVRAQSLDSPLWPIVIDAWDVLTSEALQRVRECPGHACGWLFLDTSRSGTRRWCDMRTCGNRAKVATHYARGRDNADAH